MSRHTCSDLQVRQQAACLCRGTSEWTSRQIQEAFGVADRLGLIPPTVEQPEYNLLERRKVSFTAAKIYKTVA